ncbi:hypothetical protein D3C71_2168280 [compost metagenome]
MATEICGLGETAAEALQGDAVLPGVHRVPAAGVATTVLPMVAGGVALTWAVTV